MTDPTITELSDAEANLNDWERFQLLAADMSGKIPDEADGEVWGQWHSQLSKMHKHADREIHKHKLVLGICKFPNVTRSSCAGGFGPGDHGYSHCENHSHLRRVS